jgi:hypothetical protein
MFGSDAYLLAQIANGEPDGSTDGYDMTWISPALRPLVERLLAASSNERRGIWNEFLARGFERSPTLQTTPEPERPSGAVIAPMEPSSPPNPPAPTAVTPYPGRAGAERGVKMTRALDVEPREIEWLWAGRVPLGMMTIICSRPTRKI